MRSPSNSSRCWRQFLRFFDLSHCMCRIPCGMRFALCRGAKTDCLNEVCFFFPNGILYIHKCFIHWLYIWIYVIYGVVNRIVQCALLYTRSTTNKRKLNSKMRSNTRNNIVYYFSVFFRSIVFGVSMCVCVCDSMFMDSKCCYMRFFVLLNRLNERCISRT